MGTGIGQRVANAAAALSGAYDVKAYGATGDGKTLDTPAINKAIEAAAAAGGGTVWIPAGNYLCFSIRLKSNVAPHLDEGATIIAATRWRAAPAATMRPSRMRGTNIRISDTAIFTTA
ncbi:MAG: hypothetical protein JWP63_7182 [Candidatus Solibacter sp.]|nr:hypothetical protein [Candidatus Solibacter sp.]